MDVSSLRNLISATRECVYMNSGFTGPSPEPVLARMREVQEAEARIGPASPDGLRQRREIDEEALANVAALLGAETDEVMITHGTTEGVQVVFHGYPWRPDDELVTCNLEHPAIEGPASVLEERQGVRVKRVQLPPDGNEEEILSRLEGAITARTRIVALSHIQFSCGLRLPIREIAAMAHERGALMFVDGAQTAGHIALDMRALGADFYSISGQKWLLGPLGTGAMFVAREHNRDFEPLFTTHAIADRRGEGAAFGGRVLGRYRIASQSSALVAGFSRAISLFREIGLERVEMHVNALAARLRAGIESIEGCRLTGPRGGSSASGLTTVAVEGWEPGQIVGELWSKYRIAARSVAYPAAVRFTTASFNDESDVDAALTALRDIARRSPPETAADPTAGH